MAAVGIHLDQHRIFASQPPSETGEVGGPQPILAGAMHDVDPVRVVQSQLVGKLTGAVGATVVDDQYVHIRTSLVDASDDQRQVLPLVEGGDDDQSALAGALSCVFSPSLRSAPR